MGERLCDLQHPGVKLKRGKQDICLKDQITQPA